MSYSPKTVQEAWDNHFSAFGGQDVDKILLDYDENSVITVFNDADGSKNVFKGVEGARSLFTGLFKDLHDLSTLKAPLVHVEEDAGNGCGQVFLVWSCAGCGYEKATDTFLFKSDFKIARQNIVCTKAAGGADAVADEMKGLSLGKSEFKDCDQGKEGAAEYLTYDDDACLGEKCPDISGIEYINGDKYAAPKEGQVVVLVVWGQYHKPGYKFLPMYTKLQKKYGDKVCVVGLSIDPNASYPKKFVEDPNKKYSTVFTTEFAVAWGNADLKKAFMAVNQKPSFSPPHAYVVNSEGTIVWHQDHSELGATAPSYMGLMEEQLDLIVSGKPAKSVGDKPKVEEEEEEEGEEMNIEIDGDGDDAFDFL